MSYLLIFAKAFTLVSLTAMNVRLVSRGLYGPAFLTGSALSAVWWFAAHSAATSHLPWAWLVYSLGAGMGTVCGMWIGGKKGIA